MDEYSLHQVLVDEHCAKVSEQMNHQIVCKSVVDVSLESGSSNRLLSLSECLETIQKDYPDKKIDVVVDELDGEDLNEEEIKKLKEKLKSPQFTSSRLILSLQSCKKERTLKHLGTVKRESKLNLETLGIEIFIVNKSMRFTSNIGKTVTNSLEKVEKKPNIYHCNLRKAANPERETTNLQKKMTNPEKTTNLRHKTTNLQDEPDQDFSKNVVGDQVIQKQSTMTIPTIKMDSSLKNFTGNENSSTKVTSHFEYFKATGSGINIKGEKPNFLRLKNLDKTSVSSLTFFLQNYSEREDKMMIICNTTDMIALARAALETLKLSYVEYTNSVKNLPATATSEKKLILKKWRNNAQVIVTDCRGCRGMECQEVKYNFKSKFD